MRIIDSKALKQVSPHQLAAYAISLGWSKDRIYRSNSHIYVLEGGDEIIIPDTPKLADYARVVSQLIDIFSEYSGSDQLAVYRELITADQDVIRIRAEDGTQDTTVSVNAGVDLVEHARNMLWSAACTLGTRQPHYGRLGNSDATNYMSKVRLGQTDPGSFVVTLLSPVLEPKSLTLPSVDPNQFPPSDPIGRKVTKRLSEALTAIRTAVERASNGHWDLFLNAMHQGVSANLCEALAGLVKPVNAIVITLSCARTLPSGMARSKFRFSTPDQEILREAARRYRERRPQHAPKSRFTGFVRRLERIEGHGEGTVVLRATVDARQFSVNIRLGEADYDRAVDAHRQNRQAVIEGDLGSSQDRAFLSGGRLLKVLGTQTKMDFGRSG